MPKKMGFKTLAIYDEQIFYYSAPWNSIFGLEKNALISLLLHVYQQDANVYKWHPREAATWGEVGFLTRTLPSFYPLPFNQCPSFRPPAPSSTRLVGHWRSHSEQFPGQSCCRQRPHPLYSQPAFRCVRSSSMPGCGAVRSTCVTGDRFWLHFLARNLVCLLMEGILARTACS